MLLGAFRNGQGIKKSRGAVSRYMRVVAGLVVVDKPLHVRIEVRLVIVVYNESQSL